MSVFIHGECLNWYDLEVPYSARLSSAKHDQNVTIGSFSGALCWRPLCWTCFFHFPTEPLQLHDQIFVLVDIFILASYKKSVSQCGHSEVFFDRRHQSCCDSNTTPFWVTRVMGVPKYTVFMGIKHSFDINGLSSPRWLCVVPLYFRTVWRGFSSFSLTYIVPGFLASISNTRCPIDYFFYTNSVAHRGPVLFGWPPVFSKCISSYPPKVAQFEYLRHNKVATLKPMTIMRGAVLRLKSEFP
jgi:hypothetical protein